jgi:hypothetical protein
MTRRVGLRRSKHSHRLSKSAWLSVMVSEAVNLVSHLYPQIKNHLPCSVPLLDLFLCHVFTRLCVLDYHFAVVQAPVSLCFF